MNTTMKSSSELLPSFHGDHVYNSGDDGDSTVEDSPRYFPQGISLQDGRQQVDSIVETVRVNCFYVYCKLYESVVLL